MGKTKRKQITKTKSERKSEFCDSLNELKECRELQDEECNDEYNEKEKKILDAITHFPDDAFRQLPREKQKKNYSKTMI